MKTIVYRSTKLALFASILCASAPIFSSETPTFLKKNRKALTIAATVVAAGTTIWFGYSWWQSYCIKQEKMENPSTPPTIENTPKPDPKTEPSLYERLEIAYKNEAQFILLLASINCTDITSAIYCLAFAYDNQISTNALVYYTDKRSSQLQSTLSRIFDHTENKKWNTLYQDIQEWINKPQYLKNLGQNSDTNLENLYSIYRSLVESKKTKDTQYKTETHRALEHSLYWATKKVLAKKLINLKAVPLPLLN